MNIHIIKNQLKRNNYLFFLFSIVKEKPFVSASNTFDNIITLMPLNIFNRKLEFDWKIPF